MLVEDKNGAICASRNIHITKCHFICRYDHLVDLIKLILDRNPGDGVEFISEYSKNLQRKEYLEREQRFLRPVYIGPCLIASKQILDILHSVCD